MVRLASKKKDYSLSDFIVSAKGQKWITTNLARLEHDGDTLTIGIDTAAYPDVRSIKIKASRRQHEKHIELANVLKVATFEGDKTYVDHKTITAGGTDYQIVLREHYVSRAEGTLGEEDQIGDVDIDVTLESVTMQTGDVLAPTQQDTPDGVWAIPWADIMTGLAWVAGIIVAAGCVYMLYRVWRWKKHGETLMPGWGK